MERQRTLNLKNRDPVEVSMKTLFGQEKLKKDKLKRGKDCSTSYESIITLNPIDRKQCDAQKNNMAVWVKLQEHNRYHEDTAKKF